MRGTDASLYRSVRLSLPPLVALARPRRHWRASLPDGPAFGEGAAPGWGKFLDAAPHAGLAQSRTSDAKPGSILPGGGERNMSAADECARSLAIAGSMSLLRDFLGALG
jgi:hypothetical protein